MVTPRKKGLVLQGDALVPTAHLMEQLEETGLSTAAQEALLMGLAWASGYEVEPPLEALVPIIYPDGMRARWVQWLDVGNAALLVLLARVSAHRAGRPWPPPDDGRSYDESLSRVMWSGDYRERPGPRAQGATMRGRRE
jgi:hypothetical protein